MAKFKSAESQARQARASGENLNYVTLVPQARPSGEILNCFTAGLSNAYLAMSAPSKLEVPSQNMLQTEPETAVR